MEREAIRAEGLDPISPAVVAALELVGLELGRADPNLRRNSGADAMHAEPL